MTSPAPADNAPPSALAPPRLPVFAAIVPELMPRTQLPAALALNGAALNGSRIIGPLVAGALIASAGTLYVFLLNAALSVIAGFTIMRWRREHKPNPLGRERFFSAMRVGLRFVTHSARLRVALRERARAFHIGDAPLVVKRFVIDSTVRN